jgi:hypothetical protein
MRQTTKGRSWASSIGATLVLTTAGAGFAVEVPPAEQQIASAVLAAPAERRAGAQVLGYVAEGEEIVLRELRAGSNDLVCLADRPGDESWSVACYHRSLEPFMSRGRELAAAGVTGEERMKQRWAEADAGTLQMPDAPATLYVLSGKGFDAATGEAIDGYLRYVVYTPWATEASTGLPLSPTSMGGPWLMFPGTAGAHIMINPPKPTPAEPAAPAVPATPATPAAPATPPAS